MGTAKKGKKEISTRRIEVLEERIKTEHDKHLEYGKAMFRDLCDKDAEIARLEGILAVFNDDASAWDGAVKCDNCSYIHAECSEYCPNCHFKRENGG